VLAEQTHTMKLGETQHWEVSVCGHKIVAKLGETVLEAPITLSQGAFGLMLPDGGRLDVGRVTCKEG